MNQQQLFETDHYGDLHRATDPDTSRQAAEDISPKLTGLRAEFVYRVKCWRIDHGVWPTANEVAQGDESIRKRAKECVRAGWLKAGPDRQCGVTGKNATTYETIA